MNHCYRLVFNQSSQVWQVVSEIAKSCGKSSAKSAAIVLLPLLSVLPNINAWADPALNALPTGGQVTAGQSAITQNGHQLNIVQTTQQAIINWNSYNIGANAQVTYAQPNANAISLNRVTSGSPSEIFGKLNANGQVWLINPNGVLFGANAQVNVGGIVATTLNIADDDFLNGKYKFTGNAGSVINMGNIVASNGGYVALLAPEVRNEGVISAMQGTVAMAAGNAITLDFNGNGLINVQVDSASVNTLVENKHLIQVGNGQVLMSTKAADGLITSVINNTGKIEANSMVNDGGVIRLTGAKTVINSGDISATSATQKGGTVHLLGDNVGMFDASSVNVSGKTGGGTILVGGDFQGKNDDIQNASKTFVHKDARLIADATESGNGGTVIVWANEITRYYGNVSAKGGAASGNGGFVEVSGKRLLNFFGGADLSAANGVGGSLLLDPTNITLSNAPAANTTGFTPGTDNIEAFDDDDGLDSVFNVAAGGSFAGITAGSLIRLQATNDITVDSAFDVATATGSANNRLTLEADNNININAALSITGNGTLRLIADSDNSGVGNINIAAAINTDSGGAVLTGVNIVSNSIGIINTTGAINTNSGNLNITAKESINLAGDIVTTGNILLTSNTYTNNAGANALTTTAGRWVVHTTNLAGNNFGGLNSGNQAIYGRALTVATPEAGNRYVFAETPTLTITSTNQSKTYGDAAATVVASAFTANTFVDAAAFGNVFTQDTITNALTGSATSTGSPATSNVGAYAIDVTPISSTNGYALTKSNAGNLTVNRANLNIAANNSTKAPGSDNPAFSSNYAGFVNGENPSVLIGTLDYATPANTSSPIGNYAITPFGVTANNYSINFVAGVLQVRSATFNNISVFNNALTRPELFVETCQFNSAGSAMITELDAFGLNNVDYEPALSQSQVGGVVANVSTALSCTKI